jgi:acyl-CoA thioesterase 11
MPLVEKYWLGCNLHILKLRDVAAGVAAKRHAANPCVTASMDAVHFISPIKIGDMCIITASVNRSWRSSMEIGVLVQAEDMLSGQKRYCCYSILTFVAVMEGKPIPVPKIIPQTDEEMINYQSAESRRLERIQSKDSSEPIKISSPDSKSFYALSPNVRNFSISPTGSSGSKTDDRDDILKTKLATDTFTEIVQIIFPEHANSLGIFIDLF